LVPGKERYRICSLPANAQGESTTRRWTVLKFSCRRDAATARAKFPQHPVPLQKLAQRNGRNDEQCTPEKLKWIYRSYFGTISHVDAEVGEILKTLDELGIRENTIIVFSSDHGDDLFEHAIMGEIAFLNQPFAVAYDEHSMTTTNRAFDDFPEERDDRTLSYLQSPLEAE
jgi:arylsulfatase A-like enzyme